MLSLQVTLESNEPSFVEELSRAGCNEVHSDLPEGISIQITEKSVRPGFFDTTIIVSFLMAIASGVTANVISTLICEKWRQHAKRIRVADTDVTEQSGERVEEVVVKALKGESR